MFFWKAAGIGDLVLATRFLAAVREKHPEDRISVYINNERNGRFNRFLLKHWGYLVNDF